ncbi:uncharacterized protein EAE98_007654 [Botrytis deweyae]|uniref:Uncharacterized protein n=1 Tax=Botrytis deweyae TaxID=2478750 RepID=A0ABQ7IGX3_9HELO|nr:uncharacterized protein EAE98_007654 [Botrytis deweyae]KAF7923836.1 hypothetical protein EAE98_007654 [Botrytis deweyae]
MYAHQCEKRIFKSQRLSGDTADCRLQFAEAVPRDRFFAPTRNDMPCCDMIDRKNAETHLHSALSSDTPPFLIIAFLSLPYLDSEDKPLHHIRFISNTNSHVRTEAYVDVQTSTNEHDHDHPKREITLKHSSKFTVPDAVTGRTIQDPLFPLSSSAS